MDRKDLGCIELVGFEVNDEASGCSGKYEGSFLPDAIECGSAINVDAGAGQRRNDDARRSSSAGPETSSQP